MIVIVSIGFIIYFIEKYREYKHDFSLLTFIFGNISCRKYTSDSAKLF